MPIFDADLHIHSPYSIAVSQSMSIQTLYHTAKQKGLHILTTGDITQPSWRNYVKEQVTKKDNAYWYKDLAFIPGTELEDSESIHPWWKGSLYGSILRLPATGEPGRA